MSKLEGKMLHAAIVELVNTAGHCPDCARKALVNAIADLIRTHNPPSECDAAVEAVISEIRKAIDFKQRRENPIDTIGTTAGSA